MKITYTGRQVELTPAQVKKIEVQFAKLSKLLDGKEQQEAHVTLSLERGRHTAEVTTHYHDHPLVGIATEANMFASLHAAMKKLETQAIKVKGKWRESKRGSGAKAAALPPAAAVAEDLDDASRRVFRVDHTLGRKPMTVDEAVIEMDRSRDYLVYRDANTGGLSVLLRRRDGHFDLVES
ncbi:MAG: ribosome-associated translation inhibitor RaiA [Bryobacterales bacterium]|nr:ribosome-associated translation inhibitor RaiA [Bryobacterales bacterium]